ncbi:MAG: alpha/beta hydrolase [Acidobacteria bacterium]|nr:MAG: alpha/beta hydrolase [Acidobacteriota bacterium]
MEEIARQVGPARIDIAHERLGPRDAPVVLLIMGGGAQMISWPDDFCDTLVGRGLQVIRFDNRDVGRSTHMTDAPAPNLQAVLAGDLSSVSYTLSDMAADTVGLLDVLGIEHAHLVGASLGGSIAQTIAIEHPARVRSLTSMMASTGNMAVGKPSPDAMRELAGRPPAVTRDEVIQQMLQAFTYDRSYDPLGHARQAIAFVASGDRTKRLRDLNVPTLVIHGLADRMCDVSGGRAVAEAVPGAELVLIEGMGHNLPPGLRNQLAERIAQFILRAESTLEDA